MHRIVRLAKRNRILYVDLVGRAGCSIISGLEGKVETYQETMRFPFS